MTPCQCPHCGSPAAQKVSAIVRAGSSQGMGVYITDSMDFHANHGQVTMGYTGSQTELAHLLSPPQAPMPSQQQETNKMMLWAFPLVIVGFFAGINWWVALTDSQGFAQGWRAVGAPAVFFSLIALVLAVKMVRLGLRSRKPDPLDDVFARTYQRQIGRWNELYYCPQCDSVYLPQNGAFAPANQWRHLLN